MPEANRLEQAIKETKQFLEDNRDYDDDDGPSDMDAYDELAEACGESGDGHCDLAGTEYCDWECPFSY